jgi:glucose-1-phosphate adenylyltransferase
MPDSLSSTTRATQATYAMVLAGGRGSRLGQLTDNRAKPAVPFGGKFRIIDFALSNCVNSGIRRIGVATQYKAQSLIQHLKSGWSFLDGRFGEFVDVLPAQQRLEDHWYRGTADAVYQNLDLLRRTGPELVLILAGDHIYKMDYGRLIESHLDKSADMTVACLETPIGQARAFGVMGIDADWRIFRFTEKPARPESIPGRPETALVSMGIYLLSAPFLYEQLARDAADAESSHDFGKDLIPYAVPRFRVFAHPFAESCIGSPYWRDVGTLDAYWEANMELTRAAPDLDIYDGRWPIWTHQQQLAPAKFNRMENGASVTDTLVSSGCLVTEGTVRRSVLFSNVSIAQHSVVEDSVLLPDVKIGRHVHLRQVIIDKRCRIPDGLRVGFDLELDRRRFQVSETGVTLIMPIMLGQ